MKELVNQLTDDVLDVLAERFKALGEPSRLKILRCLIEGEKCVNDITSITGMYQPNVSKQLKILHGSGILDFKQNGLQRFYFVKDPTVVRICHYLCGVE